MTKSQKYIVSSLDILGPGALVLVKSSSEMKSFSYLFLQPAKERHEHLFKVPDLMPGALCTHFIISSL